MRFFPETGVHNHVQVQARGRSLGSTRRLPSEYEHVAAALDGPDKSAPVTDVKQLKYAIASTLKTVFGIVGVSSSEFDILAFEKMGASSSEPSTALMRVHRSGLEILHGAITMCTSMNGKQCKLEVLHIGDSLMAMASGRFL
ncbi:hypothetical protein PsorP6_003891 [Peronosclerospora sorghi]|uniref:Uncharacterized protein n=1 Tax=Peronosclerospora sorghi TaxID=230839 RepID=A0ACC0VKL5_9STRA|nr:hypothetical protein PsorP6_003891 [Peronosclerospora sorghi]